ncbi:hypothetical protein ACWD7F_37920 [Streptomyces sp. NPDC005122]
MGDRLTVNTEDLQRLASAFRSGATDLTTSGRTIDDALRPSGSPFGQGAAGRSATETYAKTRTQLCYACDQFAQLSARTGNTLQGIARLYDGVEADNVHLANAWSRRD